MKEQKLAKRINYLIIYSIVSSIFILLLVFNYLITDVKGFEKDLALVTIDSLKVGFIAAERVDVVEGDGKLGISLSNSRNSPLPRFDGEILHGATNRESPNIIFFDGKGDEVGGIAFFNEENDDHQKAMRHLAFDGYKQDEVITFSHFVKNGKTNTGLYIYDRPDINIVKALNEMGILPEDDSKTLSGKIKSFEKENPERYKQIWGTHRRIAVQTNESEQSEIILEDGDGHPRLRLAVSKSGDASIEFFDEKGAITKKINPK